MNLRLITQDEISERQQFVQSGYQRSRSAFSLVGVRRLMGNTIIAMGMRVHGKLEDRCEAMTSNRTINPARGV